MLNIAFSVTYYLELCNAVPFAVDVISYLLNILMFYNVQANNLTFVGKI